MMKVSQFEKKSQSQCKKSQILAITSANKCSCTILQSYYISKTSIA